MLGVVRVDQRQIRLVRQHALALRRVLRQYLQRLDQLRHRQHGADVGGGGKAKGGAAPAKGAAKGGGAEGSQGCGAEEVEVPLPPHLGAASSRMQQVGVCFAPGTLRAEIVIPGGLAAQHGVLPGMQLVEVSGPSRQGEEWQKVVSREGAELAFEKDVTRPKVAVFKPADVVAMEERFDDLRVEFWDAMILVLRTARELADAEAGGKGRGRREELQPTTDAPCLSATDPSFHAAAEAVAPAQRPDPLLGGDPDDPRHGHPLKCLQFPLLDQSLGAPGDRVKVAEQLFHIASLISHVFDPAGGVHAKAREDSMNGLAARAVSDWLHDALGLL